MPRRSRRLFKLALLSLYFMFFSVQLYYKYQHNYAALDYSCAAAGKSGSRLKKTPAGTDDLSKNQVSNLKLNKRYIPSEPADLPPAPPAVFREFVLRLQIHNRMEQLLLNRVWESSPDRGPPAGLIRTS